MSFDEVRSVLHRLFIASAGTALRKEDEQKSRELGALLARLARIRKGAHLVDAAAGKASVGLVAAELLPIGALTVLERDPKRVEACRDAVTRLGRSLPVDVRHADVGDAEAWPARPDAVVALHACGGASDAVIDAAIRSEARFLFLVPCCYGSSVPFLEQAAANVRAMGVVTDDLLRRRMAVSLVDAERKLRLEAAGYETELDEFTGATVTPHNLLFTARRTCSDKRMATARERLAAMHAIGRSATSREL
ncbi:hypothetical protein AKJ09_01216 [Labilithrix luteola]|uniref:Methyltransferase domain-containing protein n=1 Tax=Labilithrix luteola TaxID=1391654 RepID=A0A0K1PM02_9BACT|nr:hypothetical protein AKJ09_01216 [Labilithrix luteola]